MNSNSRRETLTLVAVVILLLGICCGYAIASWRGLYADGAYFFLITLSKKVLFEYDSARLYAIWIVQLPLVLAIKAGIRDIATLATLHSAGLFVPPLILLSIALICSRQSLPLLIGTIGYICLLFLNTDMVVVSEYHVLATLSWLAFVLLLSPLHQRFLVAVCIPVLALLATRSYEAAVFLGPFLALLGLKRGVEAKDRAIAALLVASAYLFLLGAWNGLYSILNPRDPANMRNFIESQTAIMKDFLLRGSVVMFGLATVAALTQRMWLRRFAVVALLAASALVLWAIVSDPLRFGIDAQRDKRVLGGAFLLVGMLVVSAWVWWTTKFGTAQPQQFHAVLWLLVPVGVLVTADVLQTRVWESYLGVLCRAIDEHEGMIEYRKLSLPPSEERFGMFWTYPTLSALLRPKDSATIIENPNPDAWQPFDPRKDEVPSPDEYKSKGSLCGRYVSVQR